MTSSPSTKRSLTKKARIWLIVAAGLLLVVGANAHLLYVAMTSQPDCVAHSRPGDSDTPPGSFSAAQSDCSPPSEGRSQASE